MALVEAVVVAVVAEYPLRKSEYRVPWPLPACSDLKMAQ